MRSKIWCWYPSTFFFSSRRRHTRSLCDWSSDVCSSDLHMGGAQDIEWALAGARLVILQARPVTTVAAKASSVPGDDAWPTPDLHRVQPFDLWTHAEDRKSVV